MSIVFRFPDGEEREVKDAQVLRAAATLIKEQNLKLYFPLPWMRCCDKDCKKQHPDMTVNRTGDVIGALLEVAERLK